MPAQEQKPKAIRQNNDFRGQVSNMDPTDVPAGGAIKQVNVTCQIPGELAVRGGYRKVTFEN